MDDYTNIVKKIQLNVISKNYNEVNKLNNTAFKIWIELTGKLGAELKINNLFYLIIFYIRDIFFLFYLLQ